jgi:hypothetical protein
MPGTSERGREMLAGRPASGTCPARELDVRHTTRDLYAAYVTLGQSGAGDGGEASLSLISRDIVGDLV